MLRRRSYPKLLVRGLALFAVAMTILAAVASREHHSTETARNEALSRLVAFEARTIQGSNPSLAMQLALVGYGMSHTAEARSTLLDIAAGELSTRLLGRPGQSQIALGDDGHRLAVAHQAGGQVQVYALRYAQLTLLSALPGAPHTARIDALAISHSGRLLATGDSTGRVALWDLSTPAHPRLLATMSAGAGAVHALSFSPAGAALAAADADGGLQRWSLVDPAHPAAAPRLIAPGRLALQALSYGPHGASVAAVGRHGLLVVWPAHGGSRPQAVEFGSATLTAIAYSPDGRWLAAGAKDGRTQLWSLSGGALQARNASEVISAAGSVSSLAFSRDGRYLAVGTSRHAVGVWSLADGHMLARLAHPAAVTGVAFTDGDRRLISSDLSGETLLWQFPPPSSHRFSSALTGLSYSTTRPRLAVSTAAGHVDQWDIVDEWRPAPVGAWYAAPPSAAPLRAYWIQTATTTTSTTSTVPAINPHAGDDALRRTQAQTRVLSSALSPDGLLFAAAGSDHLVWVWDVSVPGRPRLIAKLSGFRRWATGVVFSNNSQTLFAASADHTVRVWDLSDTTSPQQLANSPLLGPSSPVTALALSPDGRTLAAATRDGDVWMWGVSSPVKASVSATLTAAHGAITALAFSPSDSTLVAATRHRLTFWHYRPYQAVNRICALEGTPITPGEWQHYVPGADYKPPCARWKPPVPPTITRSSS